jgi:pilus assembly protein CpaE
MNPILPDRDKIRVLIVPGPGPDPVGDWIASTISLEPDMICQVVHDISQSLDSVKTLEPDVILLDISSGILGQGDLINRLAAPLSGAAVIVMAMTNEVDTVRQAMLYGAQGFLLKPFGEGELLTSVRQAHELSVQRRAKLLHLAPGAAGQGSTDAAKAEIVAVFSPKGGVGCTMIAINLAVALKITSGQPVILMDGDLRFGDIDAALNITSTANIGTLLPSLDEVDDYSLNRALATHSSGIRVLIAPPHLDMADTFQPEQISQLLGRLARLEQGYVVVDVWSALDDYTLAILDSCQHLVIVTTPQVMALRDTHRFLHALKLLDYEPEKAMLILNNCYQRSDLKAREVERILGKPIVQTIEYAPSQVTASLNRGMPLVQEYQDSPAAQDILSLAQQIGGREMTSQEQWQVNADPYSAQKEPPRKRKLFSWRQASAKSLAG